MANCNDNSLNSKQQQQQQQPQQTQWKSRNQIYEKLYFWHAKLSEQKAESKPQVQEKETNKK